MQDDFSKAREDVIRFIKTHPKIHLFYHLDTDGIASAALIIKAVEKISGEKIDSDPVNYEELDTVENASEATMFVDVNVPRRACNRFIKRGLCIIDHHGLAEDTKDFTYVNPKMWGDNVYIPASLIVYKLFKPEVENLDWIAAIGVISDAGGKTQPEFIRSTAKKYDIKLKDNDPFFMDNKIGKAAEMINSLTIAHNSDGSRNALQIVLKTDSLDELLRNEELTKEYDKVNKRIKKILDAFEKQHESYDNVLFFDIGKSHGNYSSTIATILGLDPKYSGKVIVISRDVQENQKRFNIRANGLEINLNKIVKAIASDIGGEGGGHDKAVGFTINKEYEDTFKHRFVETIKNQRS